MRREKNSHLDTERGPDTGVLGSDRDHSPVRLRTLADLDQRTRAAKSAQRLLENIETDLGRDLSAAQRELAQRAALLGAMLGDVEARWLSSQPADLASYGRLVDRQRRVLESLGLKRQPQIVGDDHLDRLIDAVRGEG